MVLKLSFLPSVKAIIDAKEEKRAGLKREDQSNPEIWSGIDGIKIKQGTGTHESF